MTANTIRHALGVLQDEPEHETAWSELREALGYVADGEVNPGDIGTAELASLLEAARQAHEMRREYEAVAKLLEIEAALARGTEREAELVAQLASLRDEITHDDAGALAAYRRLLTLRPGDATAEEAIERAIAKRAKWKDLAQRYFKESKSAGDASFKSSLLVSAAEIAYRYGRPGLDAKAKKESRREFFDKIIGLLKDALTSDPRNRRAVLLLERLLREEHRWEELVAALEAFALESTVKEEKIATLLRLARVLQKKLGANERAATALSSVLDLAPGHLEATNALVNYFTAAAMWEHLVSLYEGQLQGGGVRSGQEVGIFLQIAMVNWKMRDKPEAAEPYFERVRKQEHAHPGMLDFFREWCGKHAEQARLLQILTDAQRSLPDGPERTALAAEIAGLAEEGANAQKAIEQWRSLLRSDPTNATARDALKRLYRQTGAFNHLADLLRADLERAAPDNAEARLPILRATAEIYRDHIKSDSALVTVLSQIIALDGQDAVAVRELARVYESLGRWRDLLTTQMRLAELEPVASTKVELYRAIARRWLDQFSNVQNAVEAYEKLHETDPEDREATSKLRELYTKRRSYRQLYELLDTETKRAEGAARRALWMEMAKLASERLDRGADASRLFRRILDEDPSDAAALDALEKQAERDKDYATVADALERRERLTEDPAAKLVALQKLGTLFAERMEDHAGSLRVWRRVLELAPGHPKALRILRDSYLAMGDFDGLTELYAQSGDWEALAEIFSAAADRAADVATKVDLSFRAAAVYEGHLRAPLRALRSYERVLEVRPTDLRATTALVPLYEEEENWPRLPSLYDTLAEHADGAGEKRELYNKLAIVTGQRLGDNASAFRFAEKAFELEPTRSGALEALEQWARLSGEWVRFAAVLEARANEATADDERRALRLKVAEVSAAYTGRKEDAIRAYRALIESNEQDAEAIEALDALLRTTPDRTDELRWLFRLRVRHASSAEAQIGILSEWALLEEEAFGAPAAAIERYREVLAIDPRHLGAVRALARLLLVTGDNEGAVRALEEERDLAEGEKRVPLEIELARLYLGRLHRPHEAFAAAKRAFDIAPSDSAVIAVLEDLLPMAEARAQAAAILEQVYAAASAWEKQAEVLAVLIATAASKSDRIALHGRLADAMERLGNLEGAFDVIARALEVDPTELSYWDRLSILANKTQRTEQFVEAIAYALPEKGKSVLPAHVEIDLAERAATLYDEMLGEIDHATPYLERILTRDPSNERAFLRLKQILTTRERWQELEALYDRVISATEDASHRADLLHEVAVVAEEIRGDSTKAIGYYERILELEPGHEQAIFALDKLYANAERYQELRGLLERRIQLAGSADTTALKLRLGTLLMNRLGDAKAALGYLEDVVSEDSSLRDARELVEKCLDVPELRQRAAIILEGVYVEREEMRELVGVLEVRLEFATDVASRRELLRRIAELRDERLGEERGAFDAYGRLLPLSPADVEARMRYLEIAGRQGLLDEAAEVLLVAARNADSPQPCADLLADVAKIYDVSAEPDRAESIYQQIIALAPDDPTTALPAIRALEKMYASRGKSRELADAIRAHVRLEESIEIRRELFHRLGVITEQQLSDLPAAIAVWRSRLEDDSTADDALSALDRLYSVTNDYSNLRDTLRQRELHATEPTVRKDIMLRLAVTLADHLDDRAEAIAAYRALLDEFGAERDSLRALSKLYEKAEQWSDVAETLEGELGLDLPDGDRVLLLTKLGDVRREHLSELEQAIDAYRQALTLDPATPAARAALEGMLGEPNARREAAEILRPLYEGAGHAAELVRVLMIQVDYENSLEGRLSLYERAVALLEGDLSDPGRAFEYAARAFREAASDPAVGDWAKHMERLADRTSAYDDLAKHFREVLPDVLDEEQQFVLTLRVAELARAKLSDVASALEYYRKALDLRPEEPRVLTALEELYEGASDHEALLEILRRRADLATDDAKRGILFKRARIFDEVLGDRDRATAVYEEILELGLDMQAVSALERLHKAAGRWGDLISLHERELDAPATSVERRAALHHALGLIYERELDEIDRAFDEYAAAFAEDPIHAETVASLEQLMAKPATASRAAAMLEPFYESRLDWRKLMAAIGARLDVSEDPAERRELLRRLAKLEEEQQENYGAALDIAAKLLAEDVTDESTWTELERLARVANASERLAQIYASELANVTSDEPATAQLAQRTGELFESQGNTDLALQFYRRAYAFAPEEQQYAFDAIDRLLSQANRAAERVSLYRDSLQYRTEVEARAATLHAIAKIEEDALGQFDAAIATYQSILEDDEADAIALDALERLYTRLERFRDLADLERRRATLSALPEDEAKWRLALGRVLKDKLSEPASAIDEFEAVLGLVSATTEMGREAASALEGMLHSAQELGRVIELLEPIYEQADDWEKLVALAQHRLALATTTGDKVAVLREAAKLLEERGNNADKAFDRLKEAFVLDPDFGETREELDRVAMLTERWDDLAAAYESGILAIDGVGQRELLFALAKLHDKRRDDPRKALEAWERLFRLDESDSQPLDEMDQLATLLSDWPTLVWVLTKRAELTKDDEERASFCRRIGEARRDMLDDPQGAIDAYERALELEPESTFTIDNLIALYEDRSDATRLVDLYRLRIERCGEGDEDLKHHLLVDAARCYEVGIGDRREAIRLLEEALAARPDDAETMTRLTSLYEGEKMWPELLRNLQARAERESAAGLKSQIMRRIGKLLATELADHARALDAYRNLLQLGYDDEAVQEVRTIGESRDELRREAAVILEPVLRVAGKYDALVDLLEMRLRTETEPSERASTLRSIAEVSEMFLSDLERSEAALLRALTETPLDSEIHHEIERVAAQIGEAGFRRYADTLFERATSIFDASVTTDLFMRLGHVAESRLSDLSRAAEAFGRAAEQGGDTREVLSALERVYAGRDDAAALRDVLERRIVLEEDQSVRSDLYYRLADLQIRSLGDKIQGLATLRLALERDPSHEASRVAVEQLLQEEGVFEEAFEILETVYRTTRRTTELGQLYARRVGRADGVPGRTRARLDLARVLENEASDTSSAQRAIEAAVMEDPYDGVVVAELQRLAEVTSEWAAAANALAKALEAADETAKAESGSKLSALSAGSELWSRLGRWRRDKIQDMAGAEGAFERALSADPENVELVRAVEELTRGEGRERDHIKVLLRLSHLEGDPAKKRDLARQAFRLAESPLADAALAEQILRELLAENEGDEWALEELTRLRQEAGDHAQVFALLLRRAEAENDASVGAALRYRAAEVASAQLGDHDKAIALYEEILEQEPTDGMAQERLRGLYERLGKHAELAKLLAMLVEHAATAATRSSLRLALARLQAESLGSPRDAIDTLRTVLEEDPDDAVAAQNLIGIFETLEQHAELADLWSKLAERAGAAGDRPLEIERMLKRAEVLELKCQDVTAALDAYEAILAKEPDHVIAQVAVARLAEQRGLWEKASAALTRMLERASGEEVVAIALRLAKASEETMDDRGVERALTRALEQSPNEPSVRSRLAKQYEKTRQWAELAQLLVGDADILREARAAESGAPEAEVALLRRAAQIHLGERNAPEDAAALLERATLLAPNDRELLLLLGDALTAAKRDREAATVLERVIASFAGRRTKELGIYHHRLGKALLALGERDAALAQFDLAFKIDPGSIEVVRDLGVLALEQNDLDRAQKTFRALLLQRLDAASPISKAEVFCYLGEIAAKQNDKARATQMFEKALENDPSLERARNMLAELKLR